MAGNVFFTNECPYCGASMEVSSDMKSFHCDYCGKKVFVYKAKDSNDLMVRRRRFTAYIIVFAVIISIILFFAAGMVINTRIEELKSKKEAVQAEESVDPFENLKVVTEKFEPFGIISGISGTSRVKGIEYIADKTDHLSNGDVITITAKAKKGYKWTRDTFSYTVSGLDTIVTSDSMISDDDRQTLIDFGTQKLRDVWASIQKEVSDRKVTYEIEPYKNYFGAIKELNFLGESGFIFLAYRVDFEVDGTQGFVYQLVEIPNTFIRPDGTLRASYDEASALYHGSVWMADFGIDEICLFEGFRSVLEMEAYLDNLDYIIYK